MENITEILASLGIAVPDDKAQELATKVAANYKTVAEFDKKIGKAKEEADDLKAQLDTAKQTIEAFNAEDVDGMKQQIADYKKKAEEAEQEYQRKTAERDFNDALKAEMESVKFTSTAAKNAVMSQIQSAGLKLVNGKIMGLNDLLESIKAEDATAFAADDGDKQPPAKFTTKMKDKTTPKYASKEDIMNIRDATERQQAIADNIELFTKGS